MSQCEPLVSNRSANRGRGELEEMSDEIIGMLRIDSVRGDTVFGEIFQVIGDDHAGLATDRGGKNMTVVRIGQFELVDEVLIARHEAIGDCTVHQLTSP